MKSGDFEYKAKFCLTHRKTSQAVETFYDYLDFNSECICFNSRAVFEINPCVDKYFRQKRMNLDK